MKVIAKTVSDAIYIYIFFTSLASAYALPTPQPPLSKPSFRISLTDSFLRLCWKAEPSWRNHIIMLISFIISLWAAASAGPLSLLSNPFTDVSHQLPVPSPMVAVTTSIASSQFHFTSPVLCRRPCLLLPREKMASGMWALKFPLPPPTCHLYSSLPN